MKRNVERDKSIINFVKKMNVTAFSTIKQDFFNDRSFATAYQVLERLCKYDELVSQRHYLVNEYIYWRPKNKPNEIKHMLMRDGFYRRLKQKCNIVLFDCEFDKFKGFRPDAFIAFETNNKAKYYAFLEVEISNNTFNTDKYITFYKSGEWKRHMDKFPILFALTDKKKIKEFDGIVILKIDEEFENFENIINKL